MALRVAIDTNRYRDFVIGDLPAGNPIQVADEIFLPFIVVAELRGGFRFGGRAEQNEKGLADFIRSFRVHVLFADEGTVHQYADLSVLLRRAGTPLPTNDVWIASLAIQHDLTLFTRDRHFERVPRLARNLVGTGGDRH